MSDTERAYEIRTVDRLLAVLNDGDENEHATRLYQQAMSHLDDYVQKYGGTHKAKLTVEIELVQDPKGVDVAITAKATLPAPPKTKQRFFSTAKGTVTAMDPGKDSLFPGTDMGRKGRFKTSDTPH